MGFGEFFYQHKISLTLVPFLILMGVLLIFFLPPRIQECGVLINSTNPGSLAEKSGFQKDELILQVNEKIIYGSKELDEMTSKGGSLTFFTSKGLRSVNMQNETLGAIISAKTCTCGDGICEGTEKVGNKVNCKKDCS